MFEPKMSRSISMPSKPNFIEPKALKRSNEKEKVYSDTENSSPYLYEDNELATSSSIKQVHCSDDNLEEIQIDEEHETDDDEDIIIVKCHQPEPNSGEEGAGSSSDVDQLSSLKRYAKDKRRVSNARRPSGHKNSWYGSSTIEIQQKDTCDDDSVKRNEENLLHQSSNRINKRLIGKNGYQNVTFKNIPKLSLRYCKDLITTLIELEWGYVLALFVLIFVGSWFIFAALWYLIGKAHGDLDFDPITGERLGEGKQPCVHGAYDMTSMFIHSLELQTTIGFGEKYPTEECPEGVFLFVFQIIASIAFEGAIVAVVYAKMARPVKLLSKFTFSKTACICLRDETICFVFRVCDPREQKSIATKIRVYFVRDIRTPEGETMKVNKELIIEGNGTSIITWPETVCHIIDEDSPFYNFTASEFNSKNYEIFVSLVGHSPLTGQATESRTSYLPHEIIWGQRFTNVIMYNPIKESYVIDYKNFHTTIAAEIPFSCAHQLEHVQRRKFPDTNEVL